MNTTQTNRFTKTKIWVLLTVFMVGLTFHFSQPVAADNHVDIIITPATNVVDVNGTVTVEVIVEAGTEPLNAIALFVDYNPADFLLVSATPSGNSVFGTQLLFNTNTPGQINYAAGANLGAPPVSGTITGLTLQFQALQVALDSPITLSTAFGRTTDATSGFVSVNPVLVDGAVSIAEPTAVTLADSAATSETPPIHIIWITLFLLLGSSTLIVVRQMRRKPATLTNHTPSV